MIFEQYIEKEKNDIEKYMLKLQKSFNQSFNFMISKLNKDYPSMSATRVADFYKENNYKLDIFYALISRNDFLFNDKEKLHEAIMSNKVCEELIDKISDWEKNTFTNLERSNNKIKKVLSKRNESYYSNNLDFQLEKVKEVFLSLNANIEKDLNTRIKEKLKNLGPSVVPQEIWHLTLQIQDKITQINKDELSENQKWEFTNLVEKRMPELLEDYLSISDYYKTKLKTVDGKTADQLLFEGLEQTYKKVSEILEVQQNNNLFNLQAKTLYMKNKKL